MNFGEWLGLILMLLSLLITIGVLVYDLSLKLRGQLTISEIQWGLLIRWQSNGYRFAEFPWWVVLLPVGVSIQALGLLIHFLSGLSR